MQRPSLSLPLILAWADAFYKRRGRWPTLDSGPIQAQVAGTWRRIDSALRVGLRGLPGGSSLARLLAAERGARNISRLPALAEAQILAWADAHRRQTGRWPTGESGPVVHSPGETWKAVDHALRLGTRGLEGGSSLARLLAQRRGVRNRRALPRLTVKQVLIWADYHRLRTGIWPTATSGCIPHARGETWAIVDAALTCGRRGFSGGFSLAQLLAEERGVRNPKRPPPLRVEQILHWADAHYRRGGYWPNRQSGPIPEEQEETWAMVDRALRHGKRELPGGSSLYRLLQEHMKNRTEQAAGRAAFPLTGSHYDHDLITQRPA
jgi:hypothetical protein